MILTNTRSLLSVLSVFLLWMGVARATDVPQTTGTAVKSLLLNPGFEEVQHGGGGLVPVAWNFTRWNNKEAITATVEETPGATGKMAVKIPACGPGAIGYVSTPQPVDGNFRYLVVNLRIKKSADCTASPWVFLSWWKGATFLGKTDLKIRINDVGMWDTVSLELPHTEIPAGAERFSLNIAVLGKEGATGSVWYDDAIVSTENFAHLFKLKSAAEFGWFEEESVKFVGADTPTEVQAVKGTVYDSKGKQVAVVTVKRDAFLRDGWVWKSPTPGLYDIAFEIVGDDGVARPVARSWVQRGDGRSVTLTKERYTAAVVKKGTWKERPTQFGLDQGDSEEHEVRMGARLGFGFMRKWFMWGDDWSKKSSLNSAPGVYEWEAMDRYLALCKQYGYSHNLGTFWGTARWASPHPELADNDICVMRYSEYPPTDLKYFGDFVGAAVERYGSDIKDWEIWNEQHLPQSTCFWKGTPTDYEALLKTAYETIKRVQPKSTVWLGGMAPRRYLPFYEEFLKTGGYSYFDMYSAHGSYPEMEITRRAEAAAGVKPKPWSSSEWHAILVSANDPVQSEAALGRRMMTDLFQQLKNGVDRVVLFDLVNGNQETEALPFSLSIGEMGQSFGLFRRRPDFEPRLSAVIMHDFLARVAGRVEFVSEYDLGMQKAVLLNNGGQPLLVVWNEGLHPMPLDPLLEKSLKPASAASTWEGKQWAKNDLLDPVSLVYFTEVDRAVLDAIKAPATALLYPSQRKKTQTTGYANVCKGPLSSVPLFSKVEEDVNPQAAWISDNVVFKGINGQSQPKGFSARFAAFAGQTGLDLAVDVQDAAFVQDCKRGEYYGGDSLQFAIDTEGNSAESEVTELSVALTPDGPVVWKYRAAFIGGDLPGHWTAEQQPVKYARAVIQKTANGMLYKVHVDWSEFYPYRFDTQKPMRFALLVNDNDGAGRLGWLEWGGGIGAEKNSSLFGKLRLGGVSQAATPNLFGKDALAQASGLWKPWWSATTTGHTVQYTSGSADAPSTIKLNLPGEGSSGGIQSAQIPVTAGETYHISARVRGKGRFVCHWVQFDAQKQKLLNDMATIPGNGGILLSEEWQFVDKSLLIPKDVAACTFNFLIFKESGSLELADVRLEKE